jgi:hypothetical protein
MTLNELRSGRVEMLPQNICSSENRPSKVSFMPGSRGELYHLCLKRVKKPRALLHDAVRRRQKIFPCREFIHTVVDKRVQKRRCVPPKCTPINALLLFAQFSCKHQNF